MTKQQLLQQLVENIESLWRGLACHSYESFDEMRADLAKLMDSSDEPNQQAYQEALQRIVDMFDNPANPNISSTNLASDMYECAKAAASSSPAEPTKPRFQCCADCGVWIRRGGGMTAYRHADDCMSEGAKQEREL